MITQPELNELKSFCGVLASESGKIIKKYFRGNFEIEMKSDDSPVTIADKSAEEKIRELITKEFPDHGILGEEFGQYNKEAEYQWVLDPIDGTVSFVAGSVIFGTLIALLKNGEPILGVFHQPILGELLIGDNNEAILNNKIVKVNDIKELKDAVLLTTDHFLVRDYQNLKNFENLMEKVKMFRHWGECYGYYMVASGFAHIMVDPIMSYWDTMALLPIIKGAGGVITDYQGNDALKGNSVIASVPSLHDEVIKILNK